MPTHLRTDLFHPAVVESKSVNDCNLPVECLLLSAELFLHLPGLLDGFGHGLVVVQVARGRDGGEDVWGEREGEKDQLTQVRRQEDHTQHRTPNIAQERALWPCNVRA